MLNKLRKIVPRPLVLAYHRTLATLAPLVYGYPSRKLRIIGVTGTTGKTTTCNYLALCLNKAGKKTAMATTANFRIGEKEWLNKFKMTMLGRFKLQKFLRRTYKAGCEYAVIEVTSEGVVQYRHKGIDFDVGVFTNLYPEHIESHGSFASYKNAKLSFMETVKDAIVVNGDDKHAKDFLNFPVPTKITFGLNSKNDFYAESIISTASGVDFVSGGESFHLDILGEHHVMNALAAIAVCSKEGVSLKQISEALRHYKIPGRMERIDKGQPFNIFVDYAFEPVSLTKALQTLKSVTSGKIIIVLGSTGGGRDTSIFPVKGKIAAEFAEIAIVTNEDPYDDDPQEIIDKVAAGATHGGMREGQNLFKILDRREAISRALKIAQPGDTVFLTGKSCEQYMIVANGEKIPWDERRVAREELVKLVCR